MRGTSTTLRLSLRTCGRPELFPANFLTNFLKSSKKMSHSDAYSSSKCSLSMLRTKLGRTLLKNSLESSRKLTNSLRLRKDLLLKSISLKMLSMSWSSLCSTVHFAIASISSLSIAGVPHALLLVAARCAITRLLNCHSILLRTP